MSPATHESLSSTVLTLKEAEKIRYLMDFYDVPAYRPDQRLIDIHPEDGLRDISMNMETCMEELAMSWGLNWHKIEGLALPQLIPAGTPTPSTFSPPPRQGTNYSA